jgi:hypothetical protein
MHRTPPHWFQQLPLPCNLKRVIASWTEEYSMTSLAGTSSELEVCVKGAASCRVEETPEF